MKNGLIEWTSIRIPNSIELFYVREWERARKWKCLTRACISIIPDSVRAKKLIYASASHYSLDSSRELVGRDLVNLRSWSVRERER